MSILFLLASLGVVNGVLISGYLIIRKQRTVADIYFGGLLMALSTRIGKSVFLYFSETVDRLILQIGLSACVFIGPFFYLYTKAIRKNQQKFEPIDLIILSLLLLAILTTGFVWPYRSFPEIWNGYIIYGIYVVWIAFVGIGLFISSTILKGVIFKPRLMNGSQQYIASIALAMIFITATYQAALFVGFTYIWGALIFSFTFYYLSGRALLTNRPIVPKSLNMPLSNGDQLLQQVNNLMTEKKPFINQGLRLEELATMAQMSKHTLSRVLNETYKNGYSQYIKEFRVNEAKKLVTTRPDLSLEGIGYEAGFSSKSAFFEAFKKVVDCTPAQWKKQQDTLTTS